MQKTAEQIKNFLQFVALKMIKHPEKAQLRVAEMGEGKLRFRLVLDKSDVAILIGRNGFTASSIRNVVKAVSQRDSIQVNLQILSTEEDQAELKAQEEAKKKSNLIKVILLIFAVKFEYNSSESGLEKRSQI